MARTSMKNQIDNKLQRLSHSYDIEGVESSTILILITLSLAVTLITMKLIEQYIYSNVTSDKIENETSYLFKSVPKV